MWIHAARKEKIQVINIPNESSEFLVISSGFFFFDRLHCNNCITFCLVFVKAQKSEGGKKGRGREWAGEERGYRL